MHGVMVVRVGEVRVMGRLLVGTGRVVRGGLLVMPGRVGKVLGGFVMMLSGYL
jgi:hypothetical protein